jgi:DNA repair photolyase
MGDPGTQVHPERRRGRGAVSNASGRYEAERREAFDDGWGSLDETPPPLRTEVTRDASRSIIARNDSPDVGFDRSINPYRGCEHGCIYCFARPTHAWLGLSPGLDFESRLFIKPDAPALLRAALGRRGYVCRPIALGTNTDPYQPLERRLGITRAVLQVLAEFGHPFTIVTKSNLVARDIDVIAPMARRGLAKVCLSVTSLDRTLARRMEPRAPTPQRRLQALAALSAAGIPTGVMLAPLIPALNDVEMEKILAAAAEAGAAQASYILVRLPLEIKELWSEWLQQHYPDRAARIMSLIRQSRGGKEYDSTFGRRMTGEGAYARLLADRFAKAIRRLGLDRADMRLDTSQFRPPPAARPQLELF